MKYSIDQISHVSYLNVHVMYFSFYGDISKIGQCENTFQSIVSTYRRIQNRTQMFKRIASPFRIWYHWLYQVTPTCFFNGLEVNPKIIVQDKTITYHIMKWKLKTNKSKVEQWVSRNDTFKILRVFLLSQRFSWTF